MPDNTRRFTGRVEDYERYRQRYPAEEILPRLRQWCGLTPEWTVADIGAGTGMVADIFLANANTVFAVEPNPDMLAQMRSTYTSPHPHASRLHAIHATAEATTLPDRSVDLIAIGRAFHWFDRDRAQAEFRRILKPAGWVAILAVDRDRNPDDPRLREQAQGCEDVLATYGIDAAQVRSGYRKYDELGTFLAGELHQEQVHSTRPVDWDTFRGHTMSLSVSPRPEDPRHQVFVRELRRYFDTYSREGILTIPTICWITAGRFADTT
jgi:SAM-dependent methyltransferase